MLTKGDMHEWLEHHYYKCDVEETPIEGTYGLIWFLSFKDGGFPKGFAVKTLPPEALMNPESSSQNELRREFAMWLKLPSHPNVVPASHFDTVYFPGKALGAETDRFLAMSMPRMAGSLEDWLENQEWGIEDRLSALAQSFEGLLHLYKHNFEGHGDLKPSNILYRDLRDVFQLAPESGWDEHPWNVQIADLGWADAWVDYGFTTKALRQYLAPERLKGKSELSKVVPYKSDMFSMGIIAAELLLGCHPAPNLRKAIQSEGKWTKCVKAANWNLDGIDSGRLRKMILRCLEFDYARRPTPEECLDDIYSELREYGLEGIEFTLQHWPEELSPVAEDQYAAWAAVKTIGLGVLEAERSRKDLEQRIERIGIVHDFETCERWLILAISLIEMMEHEEDPNSDSKISQLRESARIYLDSVLGKIDRSVMESVPSRSDRWSGLQPFERFSEAIRDAVEITGITYESEIVGADVLGPYALSTLAYSNASKEREGSNRKIVEHLLAEAIRHAPEEAVPYFFRALWRGGWELMDRSLKREPFISEKTEADHLAEQIADLEHAVRLSPDWEEPRTQLQSLRNSRQSE